MTDTPLQAEFRYVWGKALGDESRTGRERVAALRLWAVKIGCEHITEGEPQ